MSNIKKSKLIAILIIILSGAAFAGFFFIKKPAENAPVNIKLSGINPLTGLINPPIAVRPFSLRDHRGETFSENNLSRKWSFMFFGYTNCPDVCPSTLNKMNSIFRGLEKTGETSNAAFVFVSVDPKRDTTKSLSEYISYFNEDFLAVTGTDATISEFAKQLGVGYRITNDDVTEDNYHIVHSSSILLFDPLGRQTARFSGTESIEDIISDFRKIKGAGNGACCIAKKP